MTTLMGGWTGGWEGRLITWWVGFGQVKDE